MQLQGQYWQLTGSRWTGNLCTQFGVKILCIKCQTNLLKKFLKKTVVGIFIYEILPPLSPFMSPFWDLEYFYAHMVGGNVGVSYMVGKPLSC